MVRATSLVLTIAGERLEMARLDPLSALGDDRFPRIDPRLRHQLAPAQLSPRWQSWHTGSALLLMALWLLRFDIARKTVRRTGLTRFVGQLNLLIVAFLVLSGLLVLIFCQQANGADL